MWLNEAKDEPPTPARMDPADWGGLGRLEGEAQARVNAACAPPCSLGALHGHDAHDRGRGVPIEYTHDRGHGVPIEYTVDSS